MQKKLLQTLLMAAILSPTVAMAQLLPPKPPASDCTPTPTSQPNPPLCEWHEASAGSAIIGGGDHGGWVCVTCSNGKCGTSGCVASNQ